MIASPRAPHRSPRHDHRPMSLRHRPLRNRRAVRSSMSHCHCSMCRKHHGTPFATWAAAPLAGFRYTAGRTRSALRLVAGFHRSFCRVCGSVVPEAIESAGMVICPAGNLEGDPRHRDRACTCSSARRRRGTRSPTSCLQFMTSPPQFACRPTRGSRAAHGPHGAGQLPLRRGRLRDLGAAAPDVLLPLLAMQAGRSAAHAANVFYKADGLAGCAAPTGAGLPLCPGRSSSASRSAGAAAASVPRVSARAQASRASRPARSTTDPGIRRPGAHLRRLEGRAGSRGSPPPGPPASSPAAALPRGARSRRPG